MNKTKWNIVNMDGYKPGSIMYQCLKCKTMFFYKKSDDISVDPVLFNYCPHCGVEIDKNDV